MPSLPQPLFESYRRFLELNFQQMSEELPVVRAYLARFPEELDACQGYLAARGFLKSYAGNEATFNSYRTHVERLLLWSLLVAQKPLLALRRSDAEAFMEFCLRPAASWIGPVVKSRFVRVGAAPTGSTDTYQLNGAWIGRVECKWVGKSVQLPKKEILQVPEKRVAAQGGVIRIFSDDGSFQELRFR